MDFLTLPSSDAYNAVLSLFSLQHAGDDDVPAYRKAAQLLLPGGIMLSVCEYDPCKTGWQNGRDDGPLRTYGPRDTEERIEQPLLEGGMEIVENKFAGLSGRGNAMSWCDAVEQNTCRVCAIPGFFFLCGRKK
jgi:SAM-dependent methyltransferase